MKMVYDRLLIGLITLLPLCCASSCSRADSRTSYPYPPVLPVSVVAEIPGKTIYDLMGKIEPAKVEQIMVIPVYENYVAGGETASIAVAHPFVSRPGEDFEPRLIAAGQRDRLVRLVFWVPGYFPICLAGVFRNTDLIGGERRTLLLMQACRDQQESEQMDIAMRTLLRESRFVIGPRVAEDPPSPPISSMQPVLVTLSYDCAKLVRCEEYGSRYWMMGMPTQLHGLWQFGAGKVVHNRLSATERQWSSHLVLLPRPPQLLTRRRCRDACRYAEQ